MLAVTFCNAPLMHIYCSLNWPMVVQGAGVLCLEGSTAGICIWCRHGPGVLRRNTLPPSSMMIWFDGRELGASPGPGFLGAAVII